jgi:protoporphyrinogen oxidase
MEHVKYLILGAGPTGLSVAHTLLDRGERSFLVVEREPEAGGLCRSAIVDGFPLDTGGGHFLDTRDRLVLDFIFRFMPREEWDLYDRRSGIELGANHIDYPIESNIWQLPLDLQVEYITSVAYCGENLKHPEPEQFADWILWKLGTRIATDYMLPYNRKIWSVGLERLGTYWINKLPAVSFEEVLKSCLAHKPFGTIPAHRHFFYPKKHGYGEVWTRMGRLLGDRLRLSYPVKSLNITQRKINQEISADRIINTIPWGALSLEGAPEEIVRASQALVNAGISVDYVASEYPGDDHWVYIPDENVPHHRILNRRTFVPGSGGYWTETNLERLKTAGSERFINEYAYPVNTVDKPELIRRITAYAAGFGVTGAGRWGTWSHINSDVAVRQGIELVNSLLTRETS